MLVSIALIQTGCVPVIVGGGMVAGGYTAIREKKVGDSLTDSKIEMSIKKKLYSVDPKLFSEVSVNVDKGCVLLTGRVSKQEWIDIAEKTSWTVDGVNAVDNNITFGEEVSASQVVSDSMITIACRSKLLCTAAIRSVNFKLKTNDGVVFVTGVARTKDEQNLVLSTIQKVNGVKKVVSYIELTEK